MVTTARMIRMKGNWSKIDDKKVPDESILRRFCLPMFRIKTLVELDSKYPHI